MPQSAKFCGAAQNGHFDLGEFLIRALDLKRQPGSALQSALKEVRKLEPGNVVHVSRGATSNDWTMLGETDDSLIYIDETALPSEGDSRSVWEMENLHRHRDRDAVEGLPRGTERSASRAWAFSGQSGRSRTSDCGLIRRLPGCLPNTGLEPSARRKLARRGSSRTVRSS